jgi:hypothetical protein
MAADPTFVKDSNKLPSEETPGPIITLDPELLQEQEQAEEQEKEASPEEIDLLERLVLRPSKAPAKAPGLAGNPAGNGAQAAVPSLEDLEDRTIISDAPRPESAPAAAAPGPAAAPLDLSDTTINNEARRAADPVALLTPPRWSQTVRNAAAPAFVRRLQLSIVHVAAIIVASAAGGALAASFVRTSAEPTSPPLSETENPQAHEDTTEQSLRDQNATAPAVGASAKPVPTDQPATDRTDTVIPPDPTAAAPQDPGPAAPQELGGAAAKRPAASRPPEPAARRPTPVRKAAPKRPAPSGTSTPRKKSWVDPFE